MATESVQGPQSMTGIVRFYDANAGGPQLDPRAVVIVSAVFILLVKLITMLPPVMSLLTGGQ